MDRPAGSSTVPEQTATEPGTSHAGADRWAWRSGPKPTPAARRAPPARGRPAPEPGASHAGGDRWAWRSRLKANPVTRRIYRLVVGVVGSLIVILGIVLPPVPRRGWALLV